MEPVKEFSEFSEGKMGEDRMLKWFKHEHLPTHIKDTAYSFFRLAEIIVNQIKPGPERAVALRKLLESREAAIRALHCPGG